MKKFKFTLRNFIVMTLVAIVFCISGVVVSAAGDSIATATAISFDQTYSGAITETNNKDVYKFTLPSSGRVKIDVNAHISTSHYYIYDVDGNTIWKKTYVNWNNNTKVAKIDTDIDFIKGTYYLAICDNYGTTGNYNFKLSFTDAKESFSEYKGHNNNSMLDADKITLNKKYYGQIAANDKKDLYKFTLTSSGRIKIDVDAHISTSHYYIYDADGNTIWKKTYVDWNNNTKVAKIDADIDFIKGTYYLAICDNYGTTGNYNFKLSFTDAKESFSEYKGHNNNSMLDADKITLNKKYYGQIAANDKKDLYEFTLLKSTHILLEISANISCSHYYIYDADGNTIWKKTYVDWNDRTKFAQIEETLFLSEGTYYLAICDNYGTTGNYNFKVKCQHNCKCQELSVTKKATLSSNGTTKNKCYSCNQTFSAVIPKIKTVKLSTTAYTYNGKVKTPNVAVYDSQGNKLKKGSDYTVTYPKGRKAIGSYKVKVNFKGKYSGSKTLTFKIKPISISKCKVTLSTKKYTYNGKVKTPNVTVKNANGTTLKKGTHYTVTYASGRKSAGTYKVTVKMKGNYSGTKTLTFKIKPISVSKCKIKLSTTSYTYNGKVKTPNVVVKNANGTTLKKGTHYTVTYAKGRKNVGTYKVTIKMKGNYSGTKTLTFKINPPKTTVSKLTAGKKSITVAITKKSTQVTGYQIQYSTSKKFTSAKTKTISSYKTTKYTLKSLSAKKTYYVRVRTYKTVNGKKYYSGWSTIKYVKTK